MILDKIKQVGQVLILGYGREGKSVEQFLNLKAPEVKVVVADQTEGKNYLSKLNGQRLVIKSPGISPHVPEVKAAKNEGVEFTSATQLFFESCPGKIIGVTGTKGKSTTSSLIDHILDTAGRPHVLVGNIGKPALDQLDQITPDTTVVFELSSHQLMDIKSSPHIAVLLGMYPEHLDYYADLDEYISAKLNITRFQTKADTLVYIDKHPEHVKLITQVSGAGNQIPLSQSEVLGGPWAALAPEENPLKGTFNLENEACAWTVAKHLGIPDDTILKAIKTFAPLSHRLELVGGKAYNGIYFYDDALATLPEATIEAIKALGGQVETILLGGADRKQDYSQLGRTIVQSGIKNVILFPVTGERIWKAIQTANLDQKSIQHFSVESMDEAVRLSYAHTSKGKAVLMSSASPSFGLFKDYVDKANQFHAAVNRFALPTPSASTTKSATRKSSPSRKS